MSENGGIMYKGYLIEPKFKLKQSNAMVLSGIFLATSGCRGPYFGLSCFWFAGLFFLSPLW